MKVKGVMTREVVTVAPTASLKQVAMLLVEHRISGVPVVDADGKLLGVVSEGDLLVKEQGAPEGRGWIRWLIDPLAVADRVKLEAHLAREAMTAPAQTIDPERPVAAAAKLMLSSGVNRLPVVADGKLVGIVTRADLVRAFARPDEEIAREIREDVLERSLMAEPGSVHVEVADGEVRLTGALETPEDVAIVPALVGRVPGVVGVRTELVAR